MSLKKGKSLPDGKKALHGMVGVMDTMVSFDYYGTLFDGGQSWRNSLAIVAGPSEGAGICSTCTAGFEVKSRSTSRIIFSGSACRVGGASDDVTFRF